MIKQFAIIIKSIELFGTFYSIFSSFKLQSLQTNTVECLVSRYLTKIFEGVETVETKYGAILQIFVSDCEVHQKSNFNISNCWDLAVAGRGDIQIFQGRCKYIWRLLLLFVMTRSWLSSALPPVSTSLHITGGRGNQPRQRQAVLSDEEMERDVDQPHSNHRAFDLYLYILT